VSELSRGNKVVFLPTTGGREENTPNHSTSYHYVEVFDRQPAIILDARAAGYKSSFRAWLSPRLVDNMERSGKLGGRGI